MAPQDPHSQVSGLIFDSDILVWVLKKHPGAVDLVERVPLAERRVSAISRLELLYGCRDRVELHNLREHFSSKYAEVVPLSEKITASAEHLMDRFVLSRRPDVNDVLIAATALDRDEVLATANRKHFDFVPALKLKLFHP